MDPQETWRAMIQSLIEGDEDAATEHADSLLEWLDRGGFAPKVLIDFGQATSDPESPVRKLDRIVVRYVCAIVRKAS